LGGQSFEKAVHPVVKQFCFKCHSGDDPEAEIALDGAWDVARVRKQRDTWQQGAKALEGRQMPPKFMKQPTDDQRQVVLGWLQTVLGNADAVADPGRVTLRRLNRIQYINTIRDLLGVEFDAFRWKGPHAAA